MAVWTIAAQEGTGGERIAAEVAAAAGVPLLDRDALTRVAHELEPDELELEDFDALEERFCGRLRMAGLSMAMTSVPTAPAAVRELRLRYKLPELGRAITTEAARRPCVILAPAAFAALSDHPSAIHVRLRAPLPFRIAVARTPAGGCRRDPCVRTSSVSRELLRLDLMRTVT